MDHEEMANSLVREIQSLLMMSSITNIRSIYFGGGEHFEVVMHMLLLLQSQVHQA